MTPPVTTLIVANPLRAPAIASSLATRGDGDDVARVLAALREQRPALVVAAGGDGTTRAVACALMALPAAERPTLGLLPLGTGNNVARSLGVARVRRDAAAVQAALAALAHGRTRSLDVGRANGAWFVGSCAAGMDGAILAARNRWRARFRLRGGYPLYLTSCAVNLARHRPVAGTLAVDGGPPEACRVHELLVLNTALYAGEFRFDDGDHSGDGRFELLVMPSAAAYVRAFVTAWGRRLGAPVAPAPLRRFRRACVELATPQPLQLDGEELPPASRLEVDVVPSALRVVVP